VGRIRPSRSTEDASLLLGRLLRAVEWRWTLRIFAGSLMLVSGIALRFIRPRIPLPARSAQPGPLPPISYAAFKSPLFWPLLACFFTQSLGLLPVVRRASCEVL